MRKRSLIALLAVLLTTVMLFTSCGGVYFGKEDKTAYELAVDNGYAGNIQEWLALLAGEYAQSVRDGEVGKSAYELAVENGYKGTEKEWLASLVGKGGKKAADGKSVYELALDNGFEGTFVEWLDSLVIDDLGSTYSASIPQAEEGYSMTAYDLAVEQGYRGSVTEWLAFLVGADGADGKSAYDYAVDFGYKGSVNDWLASLVGQKGAAGADGTDGMSAYELALKNGYTGSVEQWLASLAGPTGDKGDTGDKGETGDKGDTGDVGDDGFDEYEIAVDNGYPGTYNDWKEAVKLSKALGEGYVSVTKYTGPLRQGDKDLTTHIQRAIDENAGKTIYFPDGVYHISSSLLLPADSAKSVSLELSNYAIIKARVNWSSTATTYDNASDTVNEAMIRLGGKDASSDISANGSEYFLKGGVIDGSGKANGISIDSGCRTYIKNVTINNTPVGIHIKQGASEGSAYASINNVNIYGTGKNSIGIITRGNDNTFTNVRVNNIQLGVKTTGSKNFYTSVHVMTVLPYDAFAKTDIYYIGSVGFAEDSSGCYNYYDSCHAEHFETGFKMSDSTSTLSACQVSWDDDIGIQRAYYFPNGFNAVLNGVSADFHDGLKRAGTYNKVYTNNIFFYTAAGGSGQIFSPVFDSDKCTRITDSGDGYGFNNYGEEPKMSNLTYERGYLQTKIVKYSSISLPSFTVNYVKDPAFPSYGKGFELHQWTYPIWEGNTCFAESCFVQADADGNVSVKTLYPITQILSVRSADLSEEYKEGVDYTVENGELKIKASGRIPVRKWNEYVFDSNATNPEGGSLLYGKTGTAYEGKYLGVYEVSQSGGGMMRWTIQVTYRHEVQAKITPPTDQSAVFASLIEKLENREQVKVVSLGDSITEKWSASMSSPTGVQLKAPNYNRMLVDYIRSVYEYTGDFENRLTHKNLGYSGSYSAQYLSGETQRARIESAIAEQPDLVILAFGMNDGTMTSSTQFVENIQTLMNDIRAGSPDTLFLVVSTCMANPDMQYSNGDAINLYQASYATALEEASSAWKDEGGKYYAALANVGQVHLELLESKNYFDTAGSGSNHPNDYMHRIYTQVCIQTMFGGWFNW